VTCVVSIAEDDRVRFRASCDAIDGGRSTAPHVCACVDRPFYRFGPVDPTLYHKKALMSGK